MPSSAYAGGLRVVCHACQASFEAPTGALAATCPACSARVTITSVATKPVALAPLAPLGGGAPAQPAPEALLGAELGGYVLERVLGGGGMGVVYEARRTPTAAAPGPALAAVKVLSPAFAADPEFVERFRREADALLALRHPNLIEVYAKGEASSPAHGGATVYFFVMERFFGEDLRALVARGPVAPSVVAAIVRGAAAGLAYAHQHGVVHRDVKPANILVAGDPAAGGAVKVVDFGVAQLAAGAYTLTSLTRSNLVLGTINYMSPEQRTDASEIDQRADVYALGVVAYELLTARLPIGAFEAPSELVPNVSGAVDRAVLSALRRDPAQRPPGALDFAALFDRALSVPRRRRLAAVGALAASLVVVAGLGVGGARLAPGLLRALERRATRVEGTKLAAKSDVAQKVEPAQANLQNAAPAGSSTAAGQGQQAAQAAQAGEPAQSAEPAQTAEPTRPAEPTAALARAAEAMVAATELALEKARVPVLQKNLTSKSGSAATGDEGAPVYTKELAAPKPKARVDSPKRKKGAPAKTDVLPALE